MASTPTIGANWRRISVPSSGVGRRLDKFLQDHFVNLSRNLIFKWLRERRIKVDGVGIMQPNYRLTHQDYEITIPRATAVYVRPPRPQGPKSENVISSWMLYDDDHIMAFNKPPDIAVQGGDGIDISIDKLVRQLDCVETPRLVHRLDQDCSGLIVLAKTLDAASHLSAQFKNREVKKSYLAVVEGQPHRHASKTWISTVSTVVKAKSREGFERMVPVSRLEGTKHVALDGESPRMCETRWRYVSREGTSFLLELFPRTGRKHQLRSMCAFDIGSPIVGDNKYDGASCARLMLHSFSMTFKHPDPKLGHFAIHAPYFRKYGQLAEFKY
ncbi:unnamed protein product (mitochondrion) [Plasmodiophora brassicae]|uniref:RNA-binding S4 domain-containing protein n=1 Tax=Plasmodiophora brassicae TaxID=37360 RepID=A0A3P3YF23_PLABS|nr:unnamed protein product [Plasmodiophora brassicae]